MYAFERTIVVSVAFGQMARPVQVEIPWNVLRYLDMNAERRVCSDGSVVYRLPSRRSVPDQMEASLASRAMIPA
ncbi:MAG TPA: hypothetical protein VLH79_11125 [Chthonomonadales bacterium]|nr:hypothetical protein [Chthonomonadales bacterium]